MDIRDLIEIGNIKKGSQANLAKSLGTSTSVLAAVKGGRQGLPDYACFVLAEILEIEPSFIIAASALVTEKNEERRKIFYPFIEVGNLPLHLVTQYPDFMTETDHLREGRRKKATAQ